MIQFGLTWDWAQDYVRELQKTNANGVHELADIMIPFSMNYAADGELMSTVLDETDMLAMGKEKSEKSLS